jgi:HTH-type transcriptional regulator / antitoxin HigA
MKQLSTFNPNWASPPGDTIIDVLKVKNISLEEFSNRMQIHESDVFKLIQGIMPINHLIAIKLEAIIGGAANFWIKRENIFREAVERLKDVEESKWVDELPISDMIKFGWVQKKDTTNLLLFFNLPNVWAWRRKYEMVITQRLLRQSLTFTSKLGSLAAWEREGEIQASKKAPKPFDKNKFIDSLQKIKLLTRKIHPKIFFKELQEICLQAGVVVLFVPAPEGCSASGLTKRLSTNNPLILLSLRYLWDDQFWFTFFHEAGHVILHGDRGTFIDEKVEGDESKIEEAEANNFALDVLIPKGQQQELLEMKINDTEIKRIANKNRISCGIIIGQLQHFKRIPFQKFNGYKIKFNKSDFL